MINRRFEYEKSLTEVTSVFYSPKIPVIRRRRRKSAALESVRDDGSFLRDDRLRIVARTRSRRTQPCCSGKTERETEHEANFVADRMYEPRCEIRSIRTPQMQAEMHTRGNARTISRFASYGADRSMIPCTIPRTTAIWGIALPLCHRGVDLGEDEGARDVGRLVPLQKHCQNERVISRFRLHAKIKHFI